MAIKNIDQKIYEPLQQALTAVVNEENGGFGLHMWAAVINRDGEIQAIVHSGEDRGEQWPGSRIIAAQKANTANAFSLPNLAISTANLFSAVQPGGSLYGLQHSNPVNPDVAYGGKPEYFGTRKDPMVGERIGGVNIFGGGLALYDEDKNIIGAIGVSGDSSTADHNIAWKVRHMLGMDHVPGGVSPTKDDNIINDINENGVSTSGWGHPKTTEEAANIATNLPTTHPVPQEELIA